MSIINIYPCRFRQGGPASRFMDINSLGVAPWVVYFDGGTYPSTYIKWLGSTSVCDA